MMHLFILEIKKLCRNKVKLKLFRLERFYFADPHYHEDEGEALMNTPHGYITNDDV